MAHNLSRHRAGHLGLAVLLLIALSLVMAPARAAAEEEVQEPGWVANSMIGRFVAPVARDKADRARTLSVLSHQGLIRRTRDGRLEATSAGRGKLKEYYEFLKDGGHLDDVGEYTGKEARQRFKSVDEESSSFWNNFLNRKFYEKPDEPHATNPFSNPGRGLATTVHRQLARQNGPADYYDTATDLGSRGIDILHKDLKAGLAAGADGMIKSLDLMTGGASTRAVEWAEKNAKAIKAIQDDPTGAGLNYVKDYVKGEVDARKEQLLGDMKDKLRSGLGKDRYDDLMEKYEKVGDEKQRMEKLLDDVYKITGNEKFRKARDSIRDFSAEKLRETVLAEVKKRLAKSRLAEKQQEACKAALAKAQQQIKAGVLGAAEATLNSIDNPRCDAIAGPIAGAKYEIRTKVDDLNAKTAAARSSCDPAAIRTAATTLTGISHPGIKTNTSELAGRAGALSAARAGFAAARNTYEQGDLATARAGLNAVIGRMEAANLQDCEPYGRANTGLEKIAKIEKFVAAANAVAASCDEKRIDNAISKLSPIRHVVIRNAIGRLNAARTRCRKERTAAAADKRCTDFYGPDAYAATGRDGGHIRCDCRAPSVINFERTRCVSKEKVMARGNRVCRDKYGPKAYAVSQGSGPISCDCGGGSRWNQERTRCVSMDEIMADLRKQAGAACREECGGAVRKVTVRPDGSYSCKCRKKVVKKKKRPRKVKTARRRKKSGARHRAAASAALGAAVGAAIRAGSRRGSAKRRSSGRRVGSKRRSSGRRRSSGCHHRPGKSTRHCGGG